MPCSRTGRKNENLFTLLHSCKLYLINQTEKPLKPLALALEKIQLISLPLHFGSRPFRLNPGRLSGSIRFPLL